MKQESYQVRDKFKYLIGNGPGDIQDLKRPPLIVFDIFSGIMVILSELLRALMANYSE